MAQHLKCTVGILAEVHSFNGHSTACAIVTLRNFRLMLELRLDMIKNVQESPVEIETVERDRPRHTWLPPRRPCYRPSVFFHHFLVVALSIPQLRRRRFSKTQNFFCHRLQNARFWKCVNFKLRKSRNVCLWAGTNWTRLLVSYLLVIYVTTLVVSQTTHCHVIGLLANMDWKSRRIGSGLIWGVISSTNFMFCLHVK